MSGHLLYLVLQAFSVFAGVFALWKGGTAERLAAGVVIFNVTVGYLAGQYLQEIGEVVRLANDGLAALALLGVTIRFGAPWMGGAMLFYASQFALHSYLIVMERPVSYWIALINNINWNGVVWCLILGTATSWRVRVRRAKARPAPAAQEPAA